MKNYYTIQEIGHVLGLSTDAIRFYEKKGLVHPHINPSNRYRMFSFINVLELLDIIYYRHLDLPVQTIKDLSETKNPKDILHYITEKEEETKRRIYYDTQLLKKIDHIKKMYDAIESHENVCSIQNFPQSIVVFEGNHREDFFVHEIQNMTKDQFVLCSFFLSYAYIDKHWQEVRTFVSLETSVLKDLQLEVPNTISQTIEAKRCIHLATRMKEGRVQPSDFEQIEAYAKKHGYKLKEICFIREIPVTFYTDIDHYYAEIFIPIE